MSRAIVVRVLGRLDEPPKKSRGCNRSPLLDALEEPLLALRDHDALLVSGPVDTGAVSRAVRYLVSRHALQERTFTVRAHEDADGFIVWRRC